MTTKQQEREAIEKIRKIVAEQGENSYIGYAMEGILELAEKNIEQDAAYSMKRRAEIAEEAANTKTTKLQCKDKEIESLQEEVKQYRGKIRYMEEELKKALDCKNVMTMPKWCVETVWVPGIKSRKQAAACSGHDGNVIADDGKPKDIRRTP